MARNTRHGAVAAVRPIVGDEKGSRNRELAPLLDGSNARIYSRNTGVTLKRAVGLLSLLATPGGGGESPPSVLPFRPHPPALSMQARIRVDGVVGPPRHPTFCIPASRRIRLHPFLPAPHCKNSTDEKYVFDDIFISGKWRRILVS